MHAERVIFFLAAALAAAAWLFTGASGAGIVLLILCLYLLLALLITRLCGRQLRVSLKAGEVPDEDGGTVFLSAKSSSRLPVPAVSAQVVLTNCLTEGSVRQNARFGLLPGREKTIRFRASDRCCGCLEAKLAGLAVTDPLGLLSRRLVLPAQKAEILKFPAWEEIPVALERIEHYDMESYRFAEGQVGGDTSETVGIRSYVPGDNVRLIHWKLSAKAGETLVKEPGLPVDARVMLLADKKQPEPSLTPEKIDALTARTAAVSYTLIKNEIAHTVGFYDIRKKEYVVCQVHTADDVTAMTACLLRAPVAQDEGTAPGRFLESEEEKRYSVYLAVTPDAGLDLSVLEEYGYPELYCPSL